MTSSTTAIFNPRAIRDFLKYAYENWARPAPTYVLLLGDAYQDYKDNLHNGTRNYVPSRNIESTLFGEVSSDNWFVTINGSDSLPDMFIGRLVAQTPQEASIMVTKVLGYERYPRTAHGTPRRCSWRTTMSRSSGEVRTSLRAACPITTQPERSTPTPIRLATLEPISSTHQQRQSAGDLRRARRVLRMGEME